MAKRNIQYRNPGEPFRALVTVRPRRETSIELGPDIAIKPDEIEDDVMIAVCEPSWPAGAGGTKEQARSELQSALLDFFSALREDGQLVPELESKGYVRV